MGGVDSDRLPLPLARLWLALRAAGPERREEAGRRFLEGATQWVAAVAVAAGRVPAEAGAPAVLAAIPEDGSWLGRAASLLRAAPGAEAPADAAGIAAALAAPGAPVPVARIGAWAVRLTGAETAAAGGLSPEVFLVLDGATLPFSDFLAYDGETDEAVLRWPERPRARIPEEAGRGQAEALAAEGGFRFGPFRIIEKLGEGGQGVMYLAEQDDPRRRVALKVLSPMASLDPAARRRMELEAAILAQIEHENVVPVYAAGEAGGVRYLAMRLVTGVDLGEALRALGAGSARRVTRGEWERACARPAEGPRREPHCRRIAEIGRDVARALHACHSRGVVHGDVKPRNIMIEAAGTTLLTDFGLARSAGTAEVTRSGEVVGTLDYLAPEVVAGRRSRGDARADVYGLGATIFELLTLCRPYGTADSRETVVRRILAEEPAPLRRLAPWVPADLATIVHRALEREPERRYATAEDLADDLDRFLAGETILARPSGAPARLAKWARRKPGAAVATITVVLGLFFAGYMLWREQVVSARSEVEGLRRAHAARVEEGLAAVRAVLDAAAEASEENFWGARQGWLMEILRNSGPEVADLLARRLRTWSGRGTGGTPSGGRPGRIEEAALAAEALARMRLADPAVPVLTGLLGAAAGEEAAAGFGSCLVRLSGLGRDDEIEAALREALVRYGTEGSFYARAVLAWPGDIEGAALPPRGGTGRRHHGLAVDGRSGLGLLDPVYVEGWIGRGLPADALEDSWEGLGPALRAVAADPGSGRAWADLGAVERAAGDLAASERALDRAVGLLPDDPLPRMERGIVRRLRGDPAAAMEDFRAVLDRTPERATARCQMVIALLDLGEPAAAIAAGTEALEAGENRYQALMYRGMARFVNGDAEAALKDAREAESTRAPVPTAEAVHLLGAALLAVGDGPGSLDARRRAVALNPRYALGVNGLGVAAMVAGDLEEALRAFSRAIELDPRLPYPWLNRGILRFDLGDREAALADLRAAVRRAPDLVEAREALAAVVNADR